MNSPKIQGELDSHDLVVLSDLHLGEGLISDPPRFSPMEDFYHDDAFAHLLQHLRQQIPNSARLVLVLNGDIFDFLTVTSVPDPNGCPALGFSVSGAETRFGLNPSAAKSLYKTDAIVAGHQTFFAALARFVAAGYRVEITRGNHDLELFFEEVQQRLLEHLTRFADGPSIDRARENVRFYPWFYLEPGRVYIEHGNQYEASNSIRYPLRPVLPPRRRSENEVHLDYPLGSLFVRYFYNRVHRLDPYTPKVISFEQYLEFIRRYNFLDLLRVARDHYPFFISALGPKSTSGRSRSSSEDNAHQEAKFQALQETTEPQDLYRQLNELKIVPMAASKLVLVREMMKPILRRIAWVSAVAAGSLYIWLLILSVIQFTRLAENVFAKATLLAVFSVATLVALFWAGNHLGRKLRRRTDRTVELCADRADRIARLAGVRLVLMGHTHVVDVRKVADGKATYANSGTWTSVDNPFKDLIPDARRLTFLYVRGDQVQAVRWNDQAGRIDAVPLFDMDDEAALARCPADSNLRPKGLKDRSWWRDGPNRPGDSKPPLP